MSGLDKMDALPRLEDLSDFKIWKKLMILNFTKTSADKIVFGTEMVPGTAASEEVKGSYTRRAAGAFQDLLRSVGKQYLDLICEKSDVKSAWDEIMRTFEMGNEISLQQAEEEMENLVPEATVHASVTKLKSVIQKLVASGGTISDSQKTWKLFKILPDSYAELIKSIRIDESYRKEDKSFDFDKIVKLVLARA